MDNTEFKPGDLVLHKLDKMGRTGRATIISIVNLIMDDKVVLIEMEITKTRRAVFPETLIHLADAVAARLIGDIHE